MYKSLYSLGAHTLSGGGGSPTTRRKVAEVSMATALARSVLPVPGGPTSKMPFGIFPPRRVNFSGVFKSDLCADAPRI